ncbi:hypothetical protein [Agarivorans sp.]|uniref:hypothetical protein n=1 Tax=Agarivorans sp. TaxID=1872412 RepID=UPI003D0945EF
MNSGGHGSYQIFSEDDFVYARLYDSWNTVTTQQYSQQLTNVVNQFKQQPWSAIFDFRRWQLMTPESIPIMREQINWALQHKLSHCIYLVEQSGILQFLVQRVHAELVPHHCKFVQLNSISACQQQLADWQIALPESIAQQLNAN